MAKRKENGGSGAFALFVILVLLVAATVVAALWILFNWISLEWKYRRVYKRHLSSFGLSQSERGQIESLEKHKSALTPAYQAANSDVMSIELEGHDLGRRQDGRFDERSFHGKDLNARLGKAQEKERDISGQIRSITDEVESLSAQSFSRYRVWTRAWDKKVTARYSILSFLAVLILLSKWAPSWLAFIGSPMQWVIGFAMTNPVFVNEELGAFVLATWTAVGICYFRRWDN